MSVDFPTNSVMSSYITTENMLTEVLRIVPYCKEHEDVWSPTLATVIMESCSQLESLWNYQAKQSPYVKNKELKITDYHSFFRGRVSPKRVIFWGETIELIYPFKEWSNTANYTTLDWWDAYNKLKHNRLLNRSRATMRNAVYSLAGLFLAILTCEFCRDGVVQQGWVSARHPNLHACLGDDSPSAYRQYCVAESKLFAYPVGFDNLQITRDWTWAGEASHRFIYWFNNYSTEDT
jgi:hypothetical protein